MNRRSLVLSGCISLSVAALAGQARAQEPAPPPPEAQSAQEGVKLRGGFSVNLGIAFGGGDVGPVVGLSGRIGAQLSPMFGVYYQLSPALLLLSGGTGVVGGGPSFNGGATVYNTAFASVTLAKMLELAAGPSADLVAVNTGVGTGTPTFGFGIGGKAALHLGHFVIGLDVHPSFYSGTAFTTLTVGLGGDWY
jgi:hypothetical protein